MLIGACNPMVADSPLQVFELNGAPTKETWPDVTNLADYNVAFPKFKGKVRQLRHCFGPFHALPSQLCTGPPV